MKTSLLVLLSLFPIASFASFGASLPSWTCDGEGIESAGISESHSKIIGDISWDCWPGGGICEQHSGVHLTMDNGDTVFQGPSFTLVIKTSEAATKNGFRGHIAATDMVDSEDEGRGMSYSVEVTCTKNNGKN